jgi:aspartyl-tRNA(Asn)/glutamyl-tRNA(Gln) amidotransferase subunit C
MATKDDVKKLASLARVELPEASLEKFTREFDSIIAYVDQLNSLEVQKGTPLLPYVNIFREDANANIPGSNTEKIAEQFPAREGDSLVVKQIITHE